MSTTNENENIETRDKALDKILASDDYKAFNAEVSKHVDELIDLFDANKEKFGCSILISASTASGDRLSAGGVAASGMSKGLAINIKKILEEKELTDSVGLVLAYFIKKMILR